MAIGLYPLCFEPVYKDYIWGGDAIIRAFQRNEPPGVYAESWEAADRPDGMSIVAHGPLAGVTFRELIEKYGTDMLGTRVGDDVFPLLIKLIDANERLSVQVHPDDTAAAKFGGEAKTEMWYVLDAAPGARVLAGLRPGVDEAAFRKAIAVDNFENILNAVPVSKGDAIFIPGGRVHAIERGCLLLEVQQNSNTTYRIHDWGRAGADGKPRPLHIKEALQVIHWDDRGDPKVTPRPFISAPNKGWEILTATHFRLERWEVVEPWKQRNAGDCFQVLFIAEGQVDVCGGGTTARAPAGTTVFLPAALSAWEVIPVRPAATVLSVTVPR